MGSGPARSGDNVFAYFCGPDEVPLEYAAEVLQVDDSYEPRPSTYWKFAPGRSDQWGITQPRSARYYRVQRLFGFTADGDRLADARHELKAAVPMWIKGRGTLVRRDALLRRPFLLFIVSLVVICATVRAADAQAWPTRPIRVLTTTSPGGISDVFMRALADKLGPRLGQPIVVENRPGGMQNGRRARLPGRARRTATRSASSMPIR